jgi:hypothetical protein
MAELQRVGLGVPVKEYTETINDNFTELDTRKQDKSTYGFATLNANGKVTQTALNADKAKDYDTTGGTIKQALDALATDIEDIEDGTTTVGKAKALDPDETPGNTKYYGTDEFGNIGWHDYTAGSEDPTGMTKIDFNNTTDWDTEGNYFTVTKPHNNKYPGDVYKSVSGDYVKVVVGIVRTSTNIKIYSDTKFTGYFLLG